MVSIAFFGVIFTVTLYFQDGRGLSALENGRPVANLTAYHVCFLVAAACALLGVIASLSIHDADAA